MWTLLLVLSTLFCPPPAVQPVVRQTLATVSFGDRNAVAQLAYIRIVARCQSGCHLRRAPEFINAIPRHVSECHFTFGASLYELLWRQRKTAPRARIPLFMHRVVAELIARKPLVMAVANQKAVERVCDEIDAGRDVIENTDTPTLVAIFKKWLGALPAPLIPQHCYARLGDALAVAADLPKAPRDTLAYLVGFLKDFVKAEAKTNMGPKAVAMNFAPMVVRTGTSDPMRMKELYEGARDFLIILIQSWDVSAVYPLQEDCAV